MKILKMTYNEIIKQTKKLSFRIGLILLLLITIALPILYKKFSYNYTYQMYSKEDLIHYEEELIESPKNNVEKIKNEFVMANIELIKQSLANKTTGSSFKSILYDKYLNEKRTLIIVNNLLNGIDINYNEIFESFDFYDERLNNYQILEKNDLLILKKEITANIDELETVIANNDYSWYLKQQVKQYKDMTKNKPSNDAEQSIKNEYEYNVNVLKVYQMLLDKNITDETDFRVREAENIIDNYSRNEIVMTEKEYQATGNKMSYDDYLKLTELNNENVKSIIAKSMYAIEHDIDYNKTGARSNFEENINLNIALLSIMTVVIAGGIVANEFQKGTIRLLIIRPAKRYKILLSKFLAVIIITIGLAIVSNLVAFLANGIVYGFQDYFIPTLIYINNNVIETSYILESIKNIAILLIPVLFVGLGAFTLSTITNNTALSVGFSIFLLLGGSLGIVVLQLIRFPFTAYTFLPYLDYTQFLKPEILISNCSMYQIYYNFTQANLVLIGWSAIFYFVSNLIFTKKDIKN